MSETEEVNKRLREQLDDALKRLSDALRQKVSDAFLQHEPEPPGSYIRQFLQRRPRSRTPPPASKAAPMSLRRSLSPSSQLAAGLRLDNFAIIDPVIEVIDDDDDDDKTPVAEKTR